MTRPYRKRTRGQRVEKKPAVAEESLDTTAATADAATAVNVHNVPANAERRKIWHRFLNNHDLQVILQYYRHKRAQEHESVQDDTADDNDGDDDGDSNARDNDKTGEIVDCENNVSEQPAVPDTVYRHTRSHDVPTKKRRETLRAQSLNSRQKNVNISL